MSTTTAEGKETFIPEKTFYIQKTKSSSIDSTCRRQGDLLSSLQDLTKAFKAFQPQVLPQALQYFNDIPDIPVIHDITPTTSFTAFSN